MVGGVWIIPLFRPMNFQINLFVISVIQSHFKVPELSPSLVKFSSNPSLAMSEENTNGPITTFHPSSTGPFFNQEANQNEALDNKLPALQSLFTEQAELGGWIGGCLVGVWWVFGLEVR